jgi:hypothetical protein
MEILKKLIELDGAGILYYYENQIEAIDDIYVDRNSHKPIAYYIGDMIRIVGQKLLINMNPKVFLPNTEQIIYVAIDLDSAKHLLDGENGEMKLGTYKDELFRGQNYITLSKSKLLSYDDILDQYRYILDRYFESLERYFSHFNIDAPGLKVSFDKLQDNDFFISHEISKNPKKKVAAALMKRERTDKTEWKLKIVNYDKEVIFEQNLKEFDFYGKRIKDGKWIEYQRGELTIPHSYISDEGWEKDIFKFTWGMPERNKDVEHYEFSLKTMQLIKKD